MNIAWQDIGDGGVIAEHDAGDETGALVTVAQVVQGGNKLWTLYAFQSAKGRPKKIGKGRVAGAIVNSFQPGQVNTREEAIRLCEQWFLDNIQNQ
jgi:hypothetical protein